MPLDTSQLSVLQIEWPQDHCSLFLVMFFFSPILTVIMVYGCPKEHLFPLFSLSCAIRLDMTLWLLFFLVPCIFNVRLRLCYGLLMSAFVYLGMMGNQKMFWIPKRNNLIKLPWYVSLIFSAYLNLVMFGGRINLLHSELYLSCSLSWQLLLLEG